MKAAFAVTVLILSASSFHVTAQTTYPRIVGYVGIIHPIVTFGNGGAHTNFDGAYIGGLPIGINVWRNPKIGFSFAVVPFVRVADGRVKMNNFLFHPGLLFSLGHGFTLAGRAAYETSGRYGATPILSKIIRKNKGSNYFIAMPVPARFGKDHPATVSIAFQFGIAF